MAGFISESTLDQIRAASDIVEVIGAYLPLKRAGANFVTLCPFHREKTPSFSVNPHRQTFHCFGCHKGGSVFTFVKEYENLTFPEAVKRLAERAGIPLEFERTPGQQQAQYLKDNLLQIHEQITQRWHGALLNEAGGQIARDYLQKRGVSSEAVELFRLGYAPDLWDDTVNWGKSKGFSAALLEQAGLVIRKEGTDHYYDRFRGRLIFPICDEQGRVVGFSGRVLSGDEKTAKYVNSPETPIFIKGKIFFGLDKSKRAILDAGFAIVCEGQLDLIACYMGGVKNIVAPQGTAFTPEHARILKRYVNEVVLCFDSDNAGQNAATRALDSLLAAGLAVRVATVPSPHDPDSFIKEQGGAAFGDLIGKAEGFFDYYLNRLCATNDAASDMGRMNIVRSMGQAVLKTGSAVLLDTYAQKTAQRLAVEPASVRREFNKVSQPRYSAPEPQPEAPPNPAFEPPPEREFWLLRYLLCTDSPAAWAADHLDLDWLTHRIVRELVSKRLIAHHADTWRGVAWLAEQYDDTQIQGLITEAVAEEPKKDLELKIAETIRMLRNDYIDRQLQALTQRLRSGNVTEAELIEIETRKRELWKLNPEKFDRNLRHGRGN